MKILQGRFKIAFSREEYERTSPPIAEKIAKTPGLNWMIWAFDDNEMEVTCIYLFEDSDSLNAYMEYLASQPFDMEGISDYTVKTWDVLEDLTKITRGPI